MMCDIIGLEDKTGEIGVIEMSVIRDALCLVRCHYGRLISEIFIAYLRPVTKRSVT